MSNQSASEEKSHKASEHKLQKAREKGDVPRSTELNSALGLGGFLVALWLFGKISLEHAGGQLRHIFATADDLSSSLFQDAPRAELSSLVIKILIAIGPWFLLPIGIVILSLIVQKSVTFSPEKLKLKPNRLSLIENAKNKFGRSGLFEFCKSLAKLTLFGASLAAFLFHNLEYISGLALVDARLGLLALAQQFFGLLSVIVGLSLALGVLDLFWQRSDFQRKNRMSHQEVKEELKESEGDALFKQIRRQKGYNIATQKMLQDVAKADVLIVNPTHYAVALQWSLGSKTAPICLAKGVDHVAHRIRDCAMENAIPIHRDPVTARAIHATVDIGCEIEPAHYQAVATAIRFSEYVRNQAKIKRYE